jgi:hypothetical protein
MDVQNHKVIALLLVGFLAFVIMVGLFLTYFIILRNRSRKLALARSNETPGEKHSFNPFGIKRSVSWLAVKHGNLQSVQAALTLHNPQPCPWSEGLAGSSDQKLFISPPISGWVLVIGPALPDPSEDVDVCYRFLVGLSRKLGHVQYFKVNSALNHHAWAQVEEGKVLRGYSWAGKTLWNQGETTPAENELKLKCYEYCEAAEVPFFWPQEANSSNCEKVHLLAARWSVDPESIDERFVEQRLGIVGEPDSLLL